MTAAGRGHPRAPTGATAPASWAAGPDLSARDWVLVNLEYMEHRAQTYAALAQRTGLAERTVQRVVEQLRVQGVVGVCTNETGRYRGVWLTTDPGVVRAQYRRLRRRGLHQLANLRRMLRLADTMEGDKPLTLWGDQ